MNYNFGDKLFHSYRANCVVNKQCIFVRDDEGKAVVVFPNSDRVFTTNYSNLSDSISKSFECIELTRKAGKTKKAIEKVIDSIDKNIPTIFISVESNETQMTQRLLCAMSDVDYFEVVRKGCLTTEQIDLLYDNLKRLQNSKLSFYYGAEFTNNTIETICREKLKENNNVRLILDYCRNDNQLKFLQDRIYGDLDISVYTFKQQAMGR